MSNSISNHEDTNLYQERLQARSLAQCWEVVDFLPMYTSIHRRITGQSSTAIYFASDPEDDNDCKPQVEMSAFLQSRNVRFVFMLVVDNLRLSRVSASMDGLPLV